MTSAFRVIGPWDVQPGLWLSHHITRSSMNPTKHWCCQHQQCVAFSLASSPEPVQHGCTYQESKPPAGIASGICEARKPPNYDKVTTLWGETSIRFHLNLNILHIMKLIWKCRPQQGGYFTSGSMFIHTHYGIESVSWLDYNFKYMTKWQFLWGFVKNITLAKDFGRKIFLWIKNFCQKYTIG